MPSPLGHALGGIAAGWLVSSGASTVGTAPGPPPSGTASRVPWLTTAALAGLGIAPDLDFLVGLHSRQSHSLGAALLAGLVAAVLARGARARWAMAATAAWASHALLDWLGDDSTPPIGVMALWPFSDAFYQSDVRWFLAIWRRSDAAGFWTHNLTAIAWELALLGPVVAALWLWKRERTLIPSSWRS